MSWLECRVHRLCSAASFQFVLVCRFSILHCAPTDLTLCSANFGVGFNKVYDWNLANALRSIQSQHTPLWRRVKVKKSIAPGYTWFVVRKCCATPLRAA